MEGVVKGAFLCNNERTSELSKKMYERNIPSTQLNISYNPRPVPTRFRGQSTDTDRRPTSYLLREFLATKWHPLRREIASTHDQDYAV